jgi:hypothetical protein
MDSPLRTKPGHNTCPSVHLQGVLSCGLKVSALLGRALINVLQRGECATRWRDPDVLGIFEFYLF